MTTGSGEPSQGTNPPQQSAPTTQPPSGLLTQEEVNKIMADVRDQGRRGAEKSILEQLGVENLDSLKTLLAKAKEEEDKNLSAKEKAEKDAAQAKAEAASNKANAEAAVLTSKVEKALIKEGLSVEAAERVRGLVNVTGEDEIVSSIESLKKDMPQLFSASTGTPPPAPGNPPSAPGAPPRQPPSQHSPRDQARTLLHERHPNLRKS